MSPGNGIKTAAMEVEREEVLQQLERILETGLFTQSKRYPRPAGIEQEEGE